MPDLRRPTAELSRLASPSPVSRQSEAPGWPGRLQRVVVRQEQVPWTGHVGRRRARPDLDHPARMLPALPRPGGTGANESATWVALRVPGAAVLEDALSYDGPPKTNQAKIMRDEHVRTLPGSGFLLGAQRPRDEPPGQPRASIAPSSTPGWPGRLHRVVRPPAT